MKIYAAALSRLLLFFFTVLLLSINAQAQTEPEKIFIPIGGGYDPVYAGFAEAVIARTQNNQAKILVLPAAYSSNPLSITGNERNINLRDAEIRRSQIEAACQHAAPANITCTVTLVPIFVRADTENLENLAAFSEDVTAIFIFGGDQTTAMQIIANTPLEISLEQAYQRGIVIAGTSAGGGMQSLNMIAGYKAGFSSGSALQFGAADLWNAPNRRGLSFGIQNAVVDQHFFQLDRMGRLLNAIALPDVPHLGIGIDAYTGVHVLNGERLENVFGLYTVAILDAETYHAADAVGYVGADHVLSFRNILVHLLSPGDFSYDITSRQPSLAQNPPQIERSFESLSGPEGSGMLFLSGDLSDSLYGNPALRDFIEQSGGTEARVAIIASGYPTENEAQQAADKYSAAIMGVHTETFVISEEAPEPWILPEGTTGIILIGDDQSKIQPQYLTVVKDAWLSGIPVMANNAAAAITGIYYSAHGPTPEDAEMAEAATQKSFLLGRTNLIPGLGMLEITVEPQVSDDNRWGRFFSLAYNYPQYLSVGLNKNTMIRISPKEAIEIGENAAFLLDLRSATLDQGTNQGFVIANGLLDVFAPGERILPTKADVNSSPQQVSTPDVRPEVRLEISPSPTVTEILSATNTPTPTLVIPLITSTQQRAATRTPRPTNTPPVVPPAADPIRSNWIILIAILSVIVVLVGVWINWRKAL